jgi:hypothetical protein
MSLSIPTTLYFSQGIGTPHPQDVRTMTMR